MKQTRLTYQMVEFIPEQLENGVLYISLRFGTAVHKCCCGCDEEVVTPLGPTEWSLRIDSNLVTLHPSVGNWSYACRSHYWIRRGRVVWAGSMSQRQIEQGRAFDRTAKQAYFNDINRQRSLPPQATNEAAKIPPADGRSALWEAVKRWWHGEANGHGK